MSSDVMSPALALLFLEKVTDILHLNIIYGVSVCGELFSLTHLSIEVGMNTSEKT